MKINQQKVEIAFGVLEKLWQKAYKTTGFPSEMKGDISNFGASIVQAGILPSVLFFSEGEYSAKAHAKAEEESTKIRRANLMKVIFDVLEISEKDNSEDEQPKEVDQVKEDAAAETSEPSEKKNSKRPLLDYVRNNLNSAEALENITEAALAVKIALRAFKFAEKNTLPESENTPTI